ncbi:MAG: EAL domain-containing protein [Gammaproteobacteria bacterium]|nr:EAL domain-containing protein [Gammaproteobacteria bacterium]
MIDTTLQQRLALHVQQTPLAVIEWDLEFRVIDWNPSAERIFGYSYDEAIHQAAADIILPEAARPFVAEVWQALLEKQGGQRSTNVNRTKDGSLIHCEWYNTPLINTAGEVIGVTSLAQNITQQKENEQALAEAKERAEVTLHSIGDAVITTDAEGRVDYLNPIAEKLTGWMNDEVQGKKLTEVFHIVNEFSGEAVINPVERCLQEGRIVGLANHTVLISKQGNKISIEDSAAPIFLNGKIIGVVMVFHDVTKTRELSKRLSWQASHDALTGLVNRREFDRVLSLLHEDAREHKNQHALLYLDLDQFKLVNDTCGHIAGDELLRQLAVLLEDSIRGSDTLARLGGDEFGLLLDQTSIDKAKVVANNLREIIKKFRFAWEEKVFEIGVSIGVSAITELSESASEILTYADIACYAAKDHGRNRVHVYGADDAEMSKRHGQMHQVGIITQALKEGRFHLYSQEMRSISNPGFCHKEMLIRMLDEDGAILAPGSFLPAAERYNLMPEIDRWVIRQCFSSLNDIMLPSISEASRDQVLFNINLSGASLNDDNLLEYILTEADHYGIRCQHICFEITETIAIANLVATRKLIKQLKARGFLFALDDFGSGVSSFAYLKNLDVDFLKIDGMLVKDIVCDPVSYSMVSAINQIGHVMGILTIAEFVENDDILKKLNEIGVDFAQGYGVSMPEPCIT